MCPSSPPSLLNLFLSSISWSAKTFLLFLSKNKKHFSLSLRTLLNNIFTVLFHYLLPFFRQLHNSVFPKLLIFLSKELFLVHFTVFQGIEIFPLREFWKDVNKWKSEGTMSGEYGKWIRTSQPSSDSFCLVIKEACSLTSSWWKIMCFLLTNSGHFSLSAAFSWFNWEWYLLELFGFPEGKANRFWDLCYKA